MMLHEGTPEEAGMWAPQVEKIRALGRRWVEEGLTTALVLLVARRGVIVLHEAYGCLTPELDSPLLPRDAIFPLASMTKPITATLAMQLVEDGLLGLNRCVQEYMPEFTGEGKEAVMVHHLLTHTSGMRDEDLDVHLGRKLGSGTLSPEARRAIPASERLALCYDAPLWKAPGEEMCYANFNYNLLGQMVERVIGQALPDLADERLFGPLGMADSHYVLPEAKAARFVRRPSTAFMAAIHNRGAAQKNWAGASSCFSTALDLAVFAQTFLNRGRYGDARILGPASVAAMTRNHIPGVAAWMPDGTRVPEASWGLGFSICGNGKWPYYWSSLQPAQAFGHGGGSGLDLWIDPVNELVSVYFSVFVHQRPDGMPKGAMDLFNNAVAAAIED